MLTILPIERQGTHQPTSDCLGNTEVFARTVDPDAISNCNLVTLRRGQLTDVECEEIVRRPAPRSTRLPNNDICFKNLQGSIMHFLYGSKVGVSRKLVATFDSEQQLLAYVRWATLLTSGARSGKFEQGSALASYTSWEQSNEPLTEEDLEGVFNNPSPSML